MNIDRQKFALTPEHYFQEVYDKTQIVLHFTAGSTAEGAVTAWRSDPVQVATAYVVDQAGTIYEVFPPKYWAYHLGVFGSDNPVHVHDKLTIGIELVNVGPLRLDDKRGIMTWWPNAYTQKYCDVNESDKFVHFNSKGGFRGFDYFASMPERQTDAVAELCVQLVAEFPSIKPVIPDIGDRLAYRLPSQLSAYGITSHQNWRRDKFDIGPAFPWSKIDAALRERWPF